MAVFAKGFLEKSVISFLCEMKEEIRKNVGSDFFQETTIKGTLASLKVTFGTILLCFVGSSIGWQAKCLLFSGVCFGRLLKH